MEGGILTHALRLGRGQPLYAEPSVDFVSFLYTPLYPAVLCALSKIFGLSYVLGRAVSILAFCGALVFLVAAVRGIAQQFESEELPAVATTAGLLGAAAVCLAFPFCGAFYDLVRCDSLWLFFVSAGLYSCSPGRSMTRIVLGALLLVLGFFTKQTAAPFMVAAAASVALTSGIERGLVFSAVAFGSTTTAILVGQYLTDGWLWIYIYRLHQSHETLLERIWPETPRHPARLRVHAPGSHRRVPPVRGLPAPAVSKALLLGIHGGHGSCDSGCGQRNSGSLRQRVHSGRLLRSASVCGVCRRAPRARRRAQGLD